MPRRTATRTHAELGLLSWNEDELAHTGRASIGGRDITIEILVDPDAWAEPVSEDFLTASAADALNVIARRWPTIQAHIRSALDDLPAESHAAGRERADDVLLGLELEAWTVYHDGASELSFGDGGLFLGHHVLVSLSRDGSVEDVSLAG